MKPKLTGDKNIIIHSVSNIKGNNQFVVGNIENGKEVEYQTTMTDEEYEVVNRVLRRAINPKTQ